MILENLPEQVLTGFEALSRWEMTPCGSPAELPVVQRLLVPDARRVT
ncbi:hypothetical protein [Cystobacter fuscus]|nr:hypothetical protein [Cystobacter fuscus]